MTPPQSHSRSRLWMALSYGLIILVFLALCLIRCHRLVHEGDVCFGDARVYARAIAVFQSGGDPYASGTGVLPFVYPPWLLYSVSLIESLFPKHIGWFLYLGAASVGILSIPWILATSYVASKWMTPFVATVIFTFQPRLVEELMLLSGNIANFLYGLILLTGIPGIRRNNWAMFYVAVTFAALIKPPFATWLILPLLAGRKQWWRSLLSLVCVSAGYWVQRILLPVTYGNFRLGIYRQIVVNQDMGYGFYNYAAKLGGAAFTRSPTGILIAHCTIFGTILLCLFLFRKYKDRPSVARLWVPVLIITAVVSNPRMQRYDSDAAIVPAIYICVESLCTVGSRRKTALLAIFLTLFAVVFTKAEMGIFLVLLTAIIVVIFRLADEHYHGRLSRQLHLSEESNTEHLLLASPH